MMETSLYNRPIYFDCYPNFALSLTNPNILDALTLNVKIDNYSMKASSKPIAIVYRIYYKFMKTTLEPMALTLNPKGHTLLLQFSTQNSRLKIPKTIRWHEVTLPEQWSLDAIVPSQKIENDRPDFITQKTNGTVLISFGSDRQTNNLIRFASSMRSRTP